MVTGPVKRQLPPLEKLALFEDLGHTPHPGQLLVHKSKALRRVLASGTRWGKSTCAAWDVIAGLLEARDSARAWLVAPTYELTQRVWRPVITVFTMQLEHRIHELDFRQQRLVVVNLAGGLSEVRAKSADKPAGLLGEELDFVVVDEAARLRDDIWPCHILPRLIDRRGWSLLVSTPRGPGWFHTEFRRGQRNRDPDCESWAMPSWTNPYVNAAAIEDERKRMVSADFKQEFAAEFLGVEPEPCESCSPKSPKACVVLVLFEGEVLRRCPECNDPVDEEGKSLVPQGARFMKVIGLSGVSRGSLDADAGPDGKPAIPGDPMDLE